MVETAPLVNVQVILDLRLAVYLGSNSVCSSITKLIACITKELEVCSLKCLAIEPCLLRRYRLTINGHVELMRMIRQGTDIVGARRQLICNSGEYPLELVYRTNLSVSTVVCSTTVGSHAVEHPPGSRHELAV